MSLDQKALDYLNARGFGHNGWSRGRAMADYTVPADGEAADSLVGLGLSLPAGAIVVYAFVDVGTTFASASDAATINLQLEGAGDIRTEAAPISDGSNPWDAGLFDGDPAHSAATMVKTTQERELSMQLGGGEALTAGQMRVYVEYFLPCKGDPSKS
jgi:hypothetical protein